MIVRETGGDCLCRDIVGFISMQKGILGSVYLDQPLDG